MAKARTRVYLAKQTVPHVLSLAEKEHGCLKIGTQKGVIEVEDRNPYEEFDRPAVEHAWRDDRRLSIKMSSCRRRQRRVLLCLRVCWCGDTPSSLDTYPMEHIGSRITSNTVWSIRVTP